ncbi:MAG TPA: DNA ligase D, partial [Casimicrobiaceae bacterium]|nr:DNA ligase D [Casimicrobiaceae bacterium]
RSACELGLEGMVSKRADCPYRAHRSAAWLKMKCLQRQAFVVGGFTDPSGSRFGFGALQLGLYEADGRLTFVGKVGTGFNDETLEVLRHRLDRLVRKETPFHNPPTGAEARKSHWVDPMVVVEVSYTEWTNDGTLRHPCFQGLREDKNPQEVTREGDALPESRTAEAKATDKNAVAGIVLSNPDKVLYPEASITKRDLALYYQAIGRWMLPHLMNRPLTLVRCPNGWNQECFYQKNADAGANPAISRVKIDNGSYYMMANSVPAIVALLQLGALEIHPWGSQAPKLGFPDRLIFDLDPADDVDWVALVQAAHLVKTLLENIGLCAFVKTTGGKGLHVVLPIEPTVPWEHAKNFTKSIAELLEHTFPDRFTSKILKVSRHGRIFIDYLRNAEGATAVAAYSIRAKAHAPVSVPIEWDELEQDVRYGHFSIRNVPARMEKLERDPWHDIRDKTHILTKAAMLKVGYKP